MKKNTDGNYFEAHIADLHNRCFERNIVTHSGFLDLKEQTAVRAMMRGFSVRAELFGGFEDAERKALFFLPDYEEDCFADYMEILEVSHSPRETVSHRDYLGALMGLGITRANIGDILVSENSAQIFIFRDVETFLLQSFEKAGRHKLSARVLSLGEVNVPKLSVKEVCDTVASLRLDNAVSAAFSISRSTAAEAIGAMKVALNDEIVTKCDKAVCEGDKIRLRGKGRAFLKEVSGKSRKGRIFIKFDVNI